MLLHVFQGESRKREELLLNLKYEEIQEQMNQREREDLEQKIRLRLQTRLDLEMQKHQILLRRTQEEDDMKHFRVREMERLAEQDKLELLTNEKKRLKLAEHHRAVRELIEERKRKREAERLAVAQTHEEDALFEKRR